jgi:hypothetical protein
LVTGFSKEHPCIVGGSGVKKDFVGCTVYSICQATCPCGFVNVIVDEEVCDLTGDIDAQALYYG